MKFDRAKVAKILKEKGAMNKCHRCSHNNFTLLEGISNISMQENIGGGLVLGGPTVPVAMIACNNCGAITSHALGALGLLPEKEEGESDE